jgi:hypothetical protein
MMDAAPMTIHLPESEVAFLEEYAERHQVTVEELIDQFVKQLRSTEKYSFHPEMKKFAGIVPKDIDARKEYYEHLEEKHK